MNPSLFIRIRDEPDARESVAPLRVCLVYDRLYPWSIGGAERWYRLLAEQLAREGHRVTYVTTRQWPVGDDPDVPGVKIMAIAPGQRLYGRRGRRLAPVLRFALALWWHLLRDGGDYDVVHGSAMSSWSAQVACRLARRRGYRLVLDWWEVWTRAYWHAYLGPAAGFFGWLMQRQTARMPHTPLAYSQLHARRLRHLSTAGPIPVIRGLLPCSAALDIPAQGTPRVVSAGRFIAEKHIPDIVLAVAVARERLPALRATFIGDGPDAGAVRSAVAATGLEGTVDLPGFVAEDRLRDTLKQALCLIHLSHREGFGLVVAEAAALGAPSIVLRHPDSAASELIVNGVNGFTCDSTDPGEVASAILRVHDAGYDLRLSTLAWFHAHRSELSIAGSLPRLLLAYRGKSAEESSGE